MGRVLLRSSRRIRSRRMIHHCREGEFIRQGLNWNYNSSDSRLRLILKIWRFSWYFRIRNARLCEYPNTNKRIVFNFTFMSRWTKDGFEQFFRGFEYSWNRRLFRINGHLISEEYLFDLVSGVADKWIA